MPYSLLIETPDTLAGQALILDLAPRSTQVLPGQGATWKLRVELDDLAEGLSVVAEWLNYNGIPFTHVVVDGVQELVCANSLESRARVETVSLRA